MPLRHPATMVALVGALTLLIGIPASATTGVDGASRPARDSVGHDVRRLVDVPFADPGFFSEGQSRFIYSTGHDLKTGRAFRVSAYDPASGTYGRLKPSMLTHPKWVGPRGSRHDRGEVHMWGPHVWKRSVRGSARLRHVLQRLAARWVRLHRDGRRRVTDGALRADGPVRCAAPTLVRR